MSFRSVVYSAIELAHTSNLQRFICALLRAIIFITAIGCSCGAMIRSNNRVLLQFPQPFNWPRGAADFLMRHATLQTPHDTLRTLLEPTYFLDLNSTRESVTICQ